MSIAPTPPLLLAPESPCADTRRRHGGPARFDSHAAGDSRAHPGVPGGDEGSDGERLLEARLAREWHDTRLRHDGLAHVWALEVPALEGCETLDDVVSACHPESSTSDPAALALIARAQAGCPIAGRCLLQALHPVLRQMARRDTRADLGDYLGACWPIVITHSARRTTRVLLDISLDTRRSVVRERAGLWLAENAPFPDTSPADSNDDLAASVIALARQLRLVPSPSADVLQSVYVDGLTSRQAAERHHTSTDMVRYRCSTAVRTLRRHRARLVSDLIA